MKIEGPAVEKKREHTKKFRFTFKKDVVY